MTQHEMAARLERVETLNYRLLMIGVVLFGLVGAMCFVSVASSQTAVPATENKFSRVAARVVYDANFPDWRKNIEQQMALLPDHRLISVTSDARDNFWFFFESGPIAVNGEVAVSGGPVEVIGGPIVVKTP